MNEKLRQRQELGDKKRNKDHVSQEADLIEIQRILQEVNHDWNVISPGC
jgi:hypothetical protein